MDALKREIELHDAVAKAVQAADRIILEASDGTVEETEYLTMQVMSRFAEKVNIGTAHRLHRKWLLGDSRG